MAIAPYPSLVDQLYRTEGKGEIVDGGVVSLPASGRVPIYAAGAICVSLRRHVRASRLPGIAISGTAGFIVRLPNRQLFSPDAAYYEGPNSGMTFFEDAPRFAVEVRSENDYGFAAEVEMEAKRRDYLAAGTAVVCDVDLLDELIVRKFDAAGGASVPVAVFRRGEVADAEPAVPRWAIAVDDLFEQQA